jgi:hypothetical protein
MIQAAGGLAQEVPVSGACEALAFPRSSLYRARQPRTDTRKRPQLSSPRALGQAGKEAVYTVLNSERLQDGPPCQVCNAPGRGSLPLFHQHHVLRFA